MVLESCSGFSAMLLLLWFTVCVLFALWTWRMRTHVDPHAPPYYPGVYPIIGHLFLLIGNTETLYHKMVKLVDECSAKGGIIRGALGFVTFYVITDPDDILTAANGCITKNYFYNFSKSWVGDGLITSTGAIWKRHRQLISPAFSIPVLHRFLGVFNSQSRILVRNLSNEMGKGPFNVLPYITENSLKSFCMTAIGVDVSQNEQFTKKYTEAIDAMLELVMTRCTTFWLHTDFMYKLLGYKQKEIEVVGILNDMCDTVIQKRRALLKDKGALNGEPQSRVLRYQPLLDLLLELSSNNELTDKEIRDEVNTFIIAGYDTSSLAVAYTLVNLGTYPEVQDRVYKEIQNVFGDDDRDLEKTDLSQLTYMEAVIKETLRLYPSAPVLARHADNDVQLKKYKISAGDQVVLMVYGQNRSAVWGADANEYRPERWLQPHPAQNIAFGSFSLGKRNCLGQHFAMMSMKTTLVHIIRNYRVTADITKLRLKFDFMMKPVTGCNIVLEPRK